VLHGCTQTAAGYDHGTGWSQLADEAAFAVLFPEQQRANNANLCFNWFVPDDIRRDGGEALSIRQMIGSMVRRHDLNPDQIFVTGLSAGGAMANVMLATYPELFAGGAIIAGLPYGVATTVPQAFDRMRGHGIPATRQLQGLLSQASNLTGRWPRLSIWQGTADKTVAASNADAIRKQWSAVHGASATATRTETIDGQERKVWTDRAGREAIELYTIDGLGHGTPLAATGDDALGHAGPFLLEAGISSTRRIAEFWGISKAGQKRAVKAAKPIAAQPRQAPSAGGVQGTIEKALRSAGLLR
jgi:poly(hydroxyalkanoate) depolymerase family esterase